MNSQFITGRCFVNRRHVLKLAGLCLLLAIPLIAVAKNLNVQVRKAQIRATPMAFGTLLAEVEYGQALQILEVKGAWTKVSTPDQKITGWIHKTSTTARELKLASGGEDAQVAASAGEMAMATKGFNSQVESAFKEKNKDVDFSWVDKMEKITITDAASSTFLKQGKVSPPEGGQ